MTSKPGIYKMLDCDNKILYIGKALNLKKRVTEIIDICLMEIPPEYNPACASCKFVTSLKKEKYI